MTSERWGEIKAVLAGVLETDPQERPATLDRLCRDDAELRREVEVLLAYEEKAEVLMNTVAAPGTGGRPVSEAGGHQADHQRAQRCPHGTAIPAGTPDPGATGA